MRHASGARSVLPSNLQQSIVTHWRSLHIRDPGDYHRALDSNRSSISRSPFSQRHFSLLLCDLGLDYHKISTNDKVDSHFGLPIRRILKSALKNRLDDDEIIIELAKLAFLLKEIRLCQIFLELGADINEVFRRSELLGSVRSRLCQSGEQLAFFPYFKEAVMRRAIVYWLDLSYDGRRHYDNGTGGADCYDWHGLHHRIRRMSRYIHEDKLTHAEALVRTDLTINYLLLWFGVSRSCSSLYGRLSKKLIFEIYRYFIPKTVSVRDLKHWSLEVQAGLLCGSLSRYQNSVWGPCTRHRNRAGSLAAAVRKVDSAEELESLVGDQHSLLSGNNPYPREGRDKEYQADCKVTLFRSHDRFNQLIERWNTRLLKPSIPSMQSGRNHVSDLGGERQRGDDQVLEFAGKSKSSGDHVLASAGESKHDSAIQSFTPSMPLYSPFSVIKGS